MGTNMYRGKRKPVAKTPVTQAIPGRENRMAPNQGGGVSFVNDFTLAERYLTLGITGPTYYATAQKSMDDAVKVLEKFLTNQKDALTLIDMAERISVGGLGMSNDPPLSVLAMAACSKDVTVVRRAMDAMQKVARTGTDLLHITSFINTRRSFGHALRTGYARWMHSKGDNLGFQMAKYQQRDGWSWRDVLRVSHVKAVTPKEEALFAWAVGKEYDPTLIPEIVKGMLMLRKEGLTNTEVESIVRDFRLPLEMIPTTLRTPKMWETVLPNLGITAIIRNVGAMSKDGINRNVKKMVLEALADEERLKKGRVHPFKVYMAFKTYNLGHGIKGTLTWAVDRDIRNALESAIYKCFKYGRPTGKRFLWGMDVSSSMTGFYFGSGPLEALEMPPLECETVMAMAVLESGDPIEVVGFDHRLRDIRLRQGMTIEAAKNAVYNGEYGSTNPGLLYEYALNKGGGLYDAFIVSTDNECNTGSQPQGLLESYRRKYNPNAKSVVLGMTTTNFSIADPNDRNSLDIAGMSADVPLVISNFVGGTSVEPTELVEDDSE